MNLNKRNFLSIKARRRIAASALSVALGFSIVGSNISTIANIAGIQTSTVKAFADETTQQGVKKVVACQMNSNYSTAFLLTDDGYVYAINANDWYSSRQPPTKLNLSGVKDILSNSNSSSIYFLMEDGSVYVYGGNYYGQLGIGNTTNQTTPVKLSLSNVKNVISNNSETTFFILEDGSVYACGNNMYGQLGIGNTTNQTTPVKLSLSNVKNVIADGGVTIFLMEDGSIYGCGYNIAGTLGTGNTDMHATPVKLSLSNAKNVILNGKSTYFIMEDGSVYVCGYNYYGQLGIGNTTNQMTPVKLSLSGVKNIYISSSSAYFLMEDSSVYVCGYNYYGQLGIGDTSSKTTPVKLSLDNIKNVCGNSNLIVFLTNNGLVYICGSKYTSMPTKANLNNISDIVLDQYNAFILKDDGEVLSACYYYSPNSIMSGGAESLDSYLIYGARYTINEIYNMEDQSKYGSWFTGFYSKSLYDDNQLMQFILNNSSGTGTLSNGGVIQDESQIRDKYFLSDGSMILIDNYGMVQYYKDLTTALPQTLPIDGSGIIGADTIVFGTGSSAVKHPVLYFGSSSKYIDTDGSLKTFTLKKTDIKKMFAYKYANGISQNMLIEKSDGSLVYLDSTGSQKDFGLNMNDVSYVMPATDVNKDIFVMKDGTLRDDKGTIALPDGVTLSKIWSNRFFEMSDGFLYTLQNGTFKNTNTLAAFAKLAQNNALLLKNGNFQLADTSGNLTNNLDVSGNDVSYMSQLDSTNMYLILNDGTTYGVGTKVQGDSLENHGININDVSSFLSNGADNVTKALVTKDGTVYSNPGSWTKNTLVHFSSDAVNSAHEENPVYTNPGDVIDDYNNSGDPDLVNKLPGGTDEKDQIEDDIAPKDISAPTLNVSGNSESWTKDDITLTVNASDEDGGSGFDKIVLPDNSEITTETGTFNVTQNGTYTFKAYDKAGNVTTQTVTVSKIDKTAPGTPTISNDNGTVTITPGTDSESGVKEVDYSIDGGAYQKYTAPFTLEVGSHIVKARTVDNAENTSSEVSKDISVSIPDKTGPNLNITGNAENWTKDDVTLTVNVSDEDGGSGFDKILLPDNSEITTETGTFNVTQNGTYTFKAYDKAGNITTQTVTVSKIDKTAPGTPTISNDKGTVTITPGTDSESGVKEVDYSIDGGAYQKYTAPFTLEVGSHIVKARTVDNAENTSSEVSKDITVSVPDKTGPNLNITGNAENWTKDDVTLTVNASDEDGGSGFDKIVLPDNSEITTATGTFNVTQNGTYTFKAYDKAGNITTQTVTVSKIDKTAPGTPTITNNNGTVTITSGTDSESGVKEADYSIDGGAYQKYTAPFTLTSGNHTVKAKTVDNAGNSSSEVTENITISDAALEEATDAVEHAEDTKKQEDLDHARDLVDALPDSSEKQDLEDRLDNVQDEINQAAQTEQDLQDAKDAVDHAGDTLDQNDLDHAKDLVDNLPDGPEKDELEDKVDDIQNQIDNKNQEEQNLAAAIAAVEKAEQTQKQEDVDSARTLVNKLPYGNDRTDLNKRLDAVQNIINLFKDAENRVQIAENVKTVSSVNSARTVVNKLPAGDRKDSLNARLDAVENAIELDNTIKAIDKDITDLNNDLDYRLRYNIQIDIESYQDKIDSLRDRVSSLPENVSDKKSEFNSRLDTIQSKLQQKKDVQDAINKVVDALNKADDSLSDEDIQAAQNAIDELPEGVDKTGYNNQLRAIKQKAQAAVAQKISDANAAVTKASRTKSLEDLNKAIELVNALPDCPQKDQLNATINIIKKFAK
ncbi:OmpL47-type beta-barrel domain-containing protein [Clostridium tyrobutyricum]|uniref:OmpL47-type beta-barrel domain-containing protein n=1 Tax=Clostridium tyrobutyricum TaxID=1519 RepID=UPI0011C73C47|nr:hypothetical protein [Clostridium tyrobutyricum]